MTHVFTPLPGQAEKWKKQAMEAARRLKGVDLGTKEEITVGFVFDDGVVKVTIKSADILAQPAKDLGETIYRGVLLAAQPGARA